jgi:hypothetical protein
MFYYNKNKNNSSSRLNYEQNQSCIRLLNPFFIFIFKFHEFGKPTIGHHDDIIGKHVQNEI